MDKRVVITPGRDNTITLKLLGEVFTVDSLDLASRLNAVIARWNTRLQRNTQTGEGKKLTAVTGPVSNPKTRS